MTATLTIQAAQPAQLPALVDLLTRNALLSEDLPTDLANFWLAYDGLKLIGSIGFEAYGSAALLRSVCVDAVYRNQALARQLYDVAFQEARQQGITDLYLITTTADQYFQRLGFEPVERSTVRAAILQTAQFSSLCPSSAIVMKQTRTS